MLPLKRNIFYLHTYRNIWMTKVTFPEQILCNFYVITSYWKTNKLKTFSINLQIMQLKYEWNILKNNNNTWTFKWHLKFKLATVGYLTSYFQIFGINVFSLKALKLLVTTDFFLYFQCLRRSPRFKTEVADWCY